MAQCAELPFHPVRLCLFSLGWPGGSGFYGQIWNLRTKRFEPNCGHCAAEVPHIRYREVDGIARLNCRIGWSRPKILCSCLRTANTLIDLQHVRWKNKSKGIALYCRKE